MGVAPYPSEVVGMIVGNVSKSETEVVLLEVALAELAVTPLLLETEVDDAEPVSTHEQAEDTLVGSLPHCDTNVGKPVVALFTVAVYDAQYCAPEEDARNNCRKQLLRWHPVGVGFSEIGFDDLDGSDVAYE